MVNTLQYNGPKTHGGIFSFVMFGKQWQDGQELTPDEVELFKNVNLGQWSITNINNNNSQPKPIEEPKQEEERDKSLETKINNEVNE